MGELLFNKSDGESQRHANLFEITGAIVSASELIPAFKKGFEETFSVDLVGAELLDVEWRKAEAIQERERQAV